MKMRRRLFWVLTVCTAGLAAAGYDASVTREERATHSSEGAKAAAVRRPVAERTSGQRSLLELERLQTARAQQPAAELFPVKSWHVEPPPPPPPPPPPQQATPEPVKPGAPPLPFVFMGRMTEGDRVTVFLVKGERAYMAAEGDVIDRDYKLRKIEPRQVTLLYLPLDLEQTLALRDPNE